MKKIFLLNLFLSYSFLFGAQVVKISKNRINMAVSSDSGAPWEVGQKVCVQNKQRQTFCGTVIKVRQEGTICKMTSPLNGVVVGDSVESEGGGSLGDSSEDGLSESKPLLKASAKIEVREPQATTGFGIKGGLVLTKIASDNSAYDSASNRKGLDLGIVLDLPLSSTGSFSLETGLNLLQAGHELPAYSVHADLIELPLILKAKLGGGDVSPIFFAGSYVTYMLSAKYIDSSGETDIKKYYNKVDIGFLGGLGLNFKMGPGTEAGLSGSYAFGLSNINDQSQTGLIEVDKIRRLQFLVHLIFRG